MPRCNLCVQLALHVLLVIGLALIAPAVQAQTPQFTQWQVQDGLPQNSVNKLLQTRDGYLWLGTHGGLVRFDGVRFKIYDINNTPELKSNRITDLYEDENGTLYIMTSDKGLSIYRNHVFINIGDRYGPIGSGQMAFDNQERLWIRRYQDDGIEVHRLSDFASVPEIIEALPIKTCKFIEATFEGDIVLVNGRNTKVWREGILPDADTDYAQIGGEITATVFNPKDQSFWIVSVDTVYQLVGHRIMAHYVIPKTPERSRYFGRAFLVSEDNMILQGLESLTPVIFDPSTGSFETQEILRCAPTLIEDMITDREGNIFYATATCGLIKEGHFRITYVDTDPEILSHNFYPVMIDSRGRTLLGSANTGLNVIEHERLIHPPAFATLPQIGLCTNIVEYAEEKYLVILSGYPGYYWTSGGRMQWKKIGHIPTAITPLRNGEILVSTLKGYYAWVGDSLRAAPRFREVPPSYVLEMHESRDGSVWIFSKEGTYRCDPAGRMSTFPELEGQAGNWLRGFHEDSAGTLFFGSYGYGLLVYSDGIFHALDTRHGLVENVVSTITEDDHGNLWLTGNKGLTKLRKQQVMAACENATVRLNPVIFDQNDGFRNAEFNGGVRQAKFHLGDGEYLFPMLDGCVRIDLNAVPENPLAPHVILEEIATQDSVYLPASKIRIPYSKGRTEFNYTALSFVSPKNVLFKYKLAGYDTDWIDAGRERRTTYTKLAPGTYTFHVIACNSDGVWNSSGASMMLTVIPPFYMTWWFRGLIIIAMAMVMSAAAILVYRRAKKREYEKGILMDVLPDLVLKLNYQGKYTDIFGNPTGLIKPFSEIKGRSVWEILPNPFADIIFAHVRKTLATQEMQLMEYQLERMDGLLRDYEGRFVYVNKNEVLYIIRDITEEKSAENQIRESQQRLKAALEEERKLKEILELRRIQELQAIVNTEERERKRIATDLHDSVGQLLSSVRINLGILGHHARSLTEQDHKLIENSQNYLQEITNEIRNISYNLLPSALNQFGLVSVLEDEVKNNSHGEMQIHFISSLNQERFDPEVELVTFRVFQEILNNTLKHAAATELEIQLIQHRDVLQLIAEDNGRGFLLAEEESKAGSSGLKNLRSRVALLNGTISIDSLPNRGTIIIAEIPLR